MKFSTDHPYVLTASCPSRMGTTAAVAGFLAARRFYLIEMHQFDDTISQRFFVRVTFCAVQGETVDLGRLRREFSAVAEAEQMEWRIHDSRERTRVLIMVSNFDHCLEDLLYRHRTGELKMDVTAVVSNHVTLQPTAARHNLPFFHLPVTPATKAEQERRLAGTRRFHAHRARRAGALHADSLGRAVRPAARPRHQHPPFIPARLQGRQALPPGLRPRREADRRDGALRDPRPR